METIHEAHHASSSPNSRRVRIFVTKKGLGIDLVPIEPRRREQFSEAYRAINPRMVVPTLVLDDGAAKARCGNYANLDEACPTFVLGSTPKEKAIIAMWERRTELECSPL